MKIQHKQSTYTKKSVSKKSSRLTRGVVGFPVVSSADLLNQCLVAVSIKWHGAMNHCVQQHTERPSVHLWPSVRPSVDNLRGGVQRAAAKGLKELVPVVEVRQAEVCDLREQDADVKLSNSRVIRLLRTNLLKKFP